MTNEELERKLQEAADRIQPRDFKEVWAEIGPRIKRKKKAERRRVWRRWIPAVTSAACVLVGCVFAMRAVYQNSLQVQTPPATQPPASTETNPSVSDPPVSEPPVSEPPADERYLDDELFFQIVTREEFYQSISQTEMELIALSDFAFTQSQRIQTESGVMKGGLLEFVDDSNAPTYIVKLKFYDDSVIVSEETQTNYDQQYTTTSGAVVEYVVEDLVGARKYCVKTEYKDLQYFLEYTTASDAGTQFFEELFD